MLEVFRRHRSMLLLTAAAFATRFVFLAHPAAAVFDEIHFGKFISAYFSHAYFFDIHPPFGKLLIAGYAALLGFRGGETFAKIGAAVDPHTLFVLRFLPALFGAALIPLAYCFLQALGGSRRAALFAAAFFLFDNAFLVQSRFILLDDILVAFGLLAALLAARGVRAPTQRRRRALLYGGAAISSAFAFSVKWTGLSFWGFTAAALAFSAFRRRNGKELMTIVFLFLVIPLAVYASLFALHFSFLTHTGSGDSFMSRAFQRDLVGNPWHDEVGPTLGFWEKFLELNREMYEASANLTATHSDASRWYAWPLMVRPIWYWQGSAVQGTARIYFLGNPVLWLVAFVSVIVGAIGFSVRSATIRALPPAAPWLLVAYAGNLLPFIFVRRVSFLYHYLPALAAALLFSALLADRILVSRKQIIIFFAALVSGFVIAAPLTYGIALPDVLARILFAAAELE